MHKLRSRRNWSTFISFSSNRRRRRKLRRRQLRQLRPPDLPVSAALQLLPVFLQALAQLLPVHLRFLASFQAHRHRIQAKFQALWPHQHIPGHQQHRRILGLLQLLLKWASLLYSR